MTRSEGAAAKPAAPGGLGRRLAAEARGYAEALAIAFLVVTFGFTTVGVIGGSMRPTLDGGVGGSNVLSSLLTGDRVFIPKYDTWLRRAGILGPYDRGEIVVLREPANGPTAQATGRRKFVIKRVIARGGDTLRIEDGRVHVDGVELADEFVTAGGEIRPAPVDFPLVTAHDGRVEGLHVHLGRTTVGTTAPSLPRDGVTPPAVPLGDPRVQLAYGTALDGLAPLPTGAPEGEPFVHEIVIPEGTYWVMGDNRGVGGSEDSRLFGPVPALSVAGRATAVIWPPRRDGDWNWRRLAPPPAFDAIPAS